MSESNKGALQSPNSALQNTQSAAFCTENEDSDSGLGATSATTGATSATTQASGSAAGATSNRRDQNAIIDAQITFLESQIALLQEEKGLQASGFRFQEEASNANSEVHGSVDRTGPPVGKPGGTKPETFPPPEARSPKSEATPDNIATFLHTWLAELQVMFGNFAELIPQLETTELDTAERMRLNGSGVRRYGFIEKVFEVSSEFPQFWPPFGEGRKEMDQYVDKIDALRNLLVWFRFVSRVVQDLLLLAGHDAFRVAGAYYTLAREGAKRKNPEAVQVYELLRLFWKRPRRTSGEPTITDVLRDTCALLHGTKDGTVSVQHKSPTTSGGVHEVMDNVHSAKCRATGATHAVQRSAGQVKEDE